MKRSGVRPKLVFRPEDGGCHSPPRADGGTGALGNARAPDERAPAQPAERVGVARLTGRLSGRVVPKPPLCSTHGPSPMHTNSPGRSQRRGDGGGSREASQHHAACWSTSWVILFCGTMNACHQRNGTGSSPPSRDCLRTESPGQHVGAKLRPLPTPSLWRILPMGCPRTNTLRRSKPSWTNWR